MKRNDLCGPSPALVDMPRKFDRLLDAGEERAGSKAAANDQPANPVSDINEAVSDLHFWRCFQEDCGVKLRKFKHVAPSLPTRQTKVGAPSVNDTLAAGNRQTAENAAKFLNVPNCVELTHVKSACGLPANENWSPLDAA